MERRCRTESYSLLAVGRRLSRYLRGLCGFAELLSQGRQGYGGSCGRSTKVVPVAAK